MYEEFLAWVLDLLQTLNEFEKRHPDDDRYMVPLIERVPLLMDTALVGFLVDEVGGVWSYRDATEAEKEQHRNQ